LHLTERFRSCNFSFKIYGETGKPAPGGRRELAEKQIEQVVHDQPEKLQGEEKPPEEPAKKKLLLPSLAALGIVFGDIGTSPLYALRECFTGRHLISPSPANILGVLSLIFWSLIIVIAVKYLLYVIRADNEGEGGILALMALLSPWGRRRGPERKILIILGIFGAALLYGDGMITPAISVLSAIEGLKVATPVLHPYVIPTAVLVLILLFAFQKKGTRGVGIVFGPVMLVWFSTIAALGISGILRHPEVLKAVLPAYGVDFFLENRWSGFLVLGAVFLVVTGGEALYADIGHFSRRIIRFSWFAVVLPALVLNYFGQGALLLLNPQGTLQPFYLLAPGWALYPLVVLATLATIIASQAIISGAFSLTRQGALLGLFPHVRIFQTSAEQIGQIYIPGVNWILMVATLLLVFTFQTSSNLAAAYGVAVSTTMVITTLLAFRVARERWHWSWITVLLITGGFLVVDLAFFGANIFRIVEGGWVPMLVGGVVFFLIATWKRGRTIMEKRLEKSTMPLDTFLRKIAHKPPLRVPGTAVFMTGNPEGVPPMLLRNLEHNQVLHERVILLTVLTEDAPRVRPNQKLEIFDRKHGIMQVHLHFGFMESPDVPKALTGREKEGLDFDPKSTSYFVGGRTLIPTEKRGGMALWREKIFSFMVRNAAQPAIFYGLPPDKVMELGIHIEL
jgi:KUP system potassium uptake protein